MRAWLLRVLSGTSRNVPHGSWSVFHPRVHFLPLHPVERLKIKHSPYLTFVQARTFVCPPSPLHSRLILTLVDSTIHVDVHPSKVQRTVVRWGTVLAVASAVYQFMGNLHSVPITGRTQVVALSQEEEFEMGNKAAEEELKSAKLITSGPRLRMCVDVAARLVSVSEHLFPRQYDWRVWLVDAPNVANACCFPGGKMIIYSGILDVIDAAVEKGIFTNRHDALAVILSHEISHALARHTAERMSYLPLMYLQIVLGLQSPLLQYVFQFAMNLPFSRKQEVEADHIGIMLMSSACYDPATAPKFWKAFSEVLKDTDDEDFDLDFYSTHPSHKKRERTLEALVEEALALQRSSSWCYQVKERVQQLITSSATQSEFLHRIDDFRSRQMGKRPAARRNTLGTRHELENEEIYKAIRTEQLRSTTSSSAGPM
ncbi:hypothetical protein Poli38472_014509 [Pythium oligandrum]|uniref:Peptidase M48 domain-containing protein n=2 Tax=Pythiaceae TaxID=4782 RepID=A0A8K1FJT4_PYTOL|nr:hypothetical protein Poli38472_014509 [Pythium oligandrum]DBA02603.1 TPA: hypothetical protein N0F65_011975 [Lagenidium giganteum]|eukprot:TMW61048.1 hypothetical protein Poli38472_014509 [Pythium oligandrum]